MLCIKEVVNIKCQHCQSETIKFGKTGNKQRYRCKNCKKIQLSTYKKHAYEASINSDIVALNSGASLSGNGKCAMATRAPLTGSQPCLLVLLIAV